MSQTASNQGTQQAVEVIQPAAHQTTTDRKRQLVGNIGTENAQHNYLNDFTQSTKQSFMSNYFSQNAQKQLKVVTYIDSMRSFVQRHCTTLHQISVAEQRIQGPPHRIEMRHKQGQDKEFYRILAGFKTLYQDFESSLDNDVRTKRQIQEDCLTDIIKTFQDDHDIKLTLPGNRASGDSLRLILEIAVITNWHQEKDDQLVMFLKNYSKILSQKSQQGRLQQRRTNELIKQREKQFNNLLAVKIPSVLADLANRYTRQNQRGFVFNDDQPQQFKSPNKFNVKNNIATEEAKECDEKNSMHRKSEEDYDDEQVIVDSPRYNQISGGLKVAEVTNDSRKDLKDEPEQVQLQNSGSLRDAAAIMASMNRPLSQNKSHELDNNSIVIENTGVYGAAAPQHSDSKQKLKYFCAKRRGGQAESTSLKSLSLNERHDKGVSSEKKQKKSKDQPCDMNVNVNLQNPNQHTIQKLNVSLNVNVHKKKFFFNTVVHQPSPKSDKQPDETVCASGINNKAAATTAAEQEQYNYQRPIRQTRRQHQLLNVSQEVAKNHLTSLMSPNNPKQAGKGTILYPQLNQFGIGGIPADHIDLTPLMGAASSKLGSCTVDSSFAGTPPKIGGRLQQPCTPVMPCRLFDDGKNEMAQPCQKCSCNPNAKAIQQYQQQQNQLPPRLSVQTCTSPFNNRLLPQQSAPQPSQQPAMYASYVSNKVWSPQISVPPPQAGQSQTSSNVPHLQLFFNKDGLVSTQPRTVGSCSPPIQHQQQQHQQHTSQLQTKRSKQDLLQDQRTFLAKDQYKVSTSIRKQLYLSQEATDQCISTTAIKIQQAPMTQSNKTSNNESFNFPKIVKSGGCSRTSKAGKQYEIKRLQTTMNSVKDQSTTPHQQLDDYNQLGNSTGSVSRLTHQDETIQQSPQTEPATSTTGRGVGSAAAQSQQYKQYMMRLSEQLNNTNVKFGSAAQQQQQSASKSKVLPAFETRLISQQQLLNPHVSNGLIPTAGQMTFKCQKPANQQNIWQPNTQLQPQNDKFGRISFKFEVFRKREETALRHHASIGESDYTTEQQSKGTARSENGKLVFNNKLTRQESSVDERNAQQQSLNINKSSSSGKPQPQQKQSSSKIQDQLSSIIQKRRGRQRC